MSNAHPSSNTAANSVSSTASEPPSSAELVVQAEALFETYLNGRLGHAQRELEAARLNLSREPASPLRKQHAREAEQAVETLRAQIAAQAGRTRQARDRAGSAEAEPNEATTSAQPTAEFRTVQSERAAQAIPGSAMAGDLRPIMQTADDGSSRSTAKHLAKTG